MARIEDTIQIKHDSRIAQLAKITFNRHIHHFLLLTSHLLIHNIYIFALPRTLALFLAQNKAIILFKLLLSEHQHHHFTSSLHSCSLGYLLLNFLAALVFFAVELEAYNIYSLFFCYFKLRFFFAGPRPLVYTLAARKLCPNRPQLRVVGTYDIFRFNCESEHAT